MSLLRGGQRIDLAWLQRPSPDFRNRERHFDTVSRETRSSAATAWFDPPSAQDRMIRDRSASYWAVFRRRTHASLTFITVAGPPRF